LYGKCCSSLPDLIDNNIVRYLIILLSLQTQITFHVRIVQFLFFDIGHVCTLKNL
jgi:hypothetical protein